MFAKDTAAGTYCGGEEDEAVCGGPFSALCASMRPQEEEMEGFKVEVMTNIVSYFFHFWPPFTSGVRPKRSTVVHVG